MPDGARQSPLDRLRDGPYTQSGPEIGRALARLDEIRAIAAGFRQVDRLPSGKVAALARFAAATKAQAVARLSPLGRKHVNMLGRYAFTLPETVARGALRPLRDPRKAGPDEP